MNKFVDFFSFIIAEFKDEASNILEIPQDTFRHLTNLKADSISLLVEEGDRALLFYIRDEECVVLGSILNKSSRKFKQLLILSIDPTNENILDNTGNILQKKALKESLKNWLIKDIA